MTSDRDDYDLLIPVRIETEAGIKEADLRLRNGVGEAVIETEAKPLSVGIDQGRDLFRHLAADEAPPILRDVTLDQDALTVIAVDGNDEARKIAEELAGRVLDTGVRPAGLDDEAIAKAPLMLIGLADHMEGALAKAGLEGVPEDLADRGTARSWVANRGDAPPVLVVEADSEDALAALLRPLPHYSRNSFLVFEGRKMVRKGVWTAGDNALTRRFD